jgi:hypothetical protein
VKAAEERLRQARAARKALDPPAQDEESHVTRTYSSFHQYKSGGFGAPRDYDAEAARILEQREALRDG